MPRLPDGLAGAAAFLYSSELAARDDAEFGGCGFVVEVAAPGGAAFRYVVTNSHVVSSGGHTVRVGGGHSELVRTIPPDEWEHALQDDVAVARLSGPLGGDHAALAHALVLADFMPTWERMEELNVGPGDDVLLLGRLTAARRQGLTPVLRFGNLAAWPHQRVRDASGRFVDAYLAEMRSFAGDSGSAAFVYIGPGSYRGNGGMMPFYTEQVGLLGIVFGHIKAYGRVVHQTTSARVDDHVTELNTAVALVCPWFRIQELIESEYLVAQRQDEERSWQESAGH